MYASGYTICNTRQHFYCCIYKQSKPPNNKDEKGESILFYFDKNCIYVNKDIFLEHYKKKL